MIINTSEISVLKLQALMAGAIAPRPIALVSTIDKSGNPNLSPFSFYNSFSINPPILVFSPSRRVRDNSIKHTYENILEVPEVSVNVVNYEIVEQVSLSSTEYEKGVNEFIKSGLTPLKSELIKPFGVKESPVRFECKVINTIELGAEGGAGNLVICQILRVHISEEVLNQEGLIDPHKIDLVGRLGEDYYVRASGNAVFTVKKPLITKGIGFDALPDSIKNSKILTGNDLGKLANIEKIPEREAVIKFIKEVESFDFNAEEEVIHKKASELLKQNEIISAWLYLLAHERGQIRV